MARGSLASSQRSMRLVEQGRLGLHPRPALGVGLGVEAVGQEVHHVGHAGRLQHHLVAAGLEVDRVGRGPGPLRGQAAGGGAVDVGDGRGRTASPAQSDVGVRWMASTAADAGPARRPGAGGCWRSRRPSRWWRSSRRPAAGRRRPAGVDEVLAPPGPGSSGSAVSVARVVAVVLEGEPGAWAGPGRASRGRPGAGAAASRVSSTRRIRLSWSRRLVLPVAARPVDHQLEPGPLLVLGHVLVDEGVGEAGEGGAPGRRR